MARGVYEISLSCVRICADHGKSDAAGWEDIVPYLEPSLFLFVSSSCHHDISRAICCSIQRKFDTPSCLL
jgi:hypothetical protein